MSTSELRDVSCLPQRTNLCGRITIALASEPRWAPRSAESPSTCSAVACGAMGVDTRHYGIAPARDASAEEIYIAY